MRKTRLSFLTMTLALGVVLPAAPSHAATTGCDPES
jgi:hypothetical protein